MSVIYAAKDKVDQLYGFYLWTLTIADERTKGWMLVDSPVPTLLYTALYLFIVWIGPKIMQNQKPLSLNWILVPYNLAMAGLNFYIAYELLTASLKLNYSYICQPVTALNDPNEIRIANAVWWYYFSKLLEFCDTFFFIVRKKNNQLSFLHIYHHSTMFSLWWIGVKWVPSGSTFLPAMVNSFIHVLMYTYYGLSALGPHVTKYLWWKKYLTIMQLIQFSFALLLGANGIRVGCDFPLWMQYALVGYMLSFIVLFGNFYAKAYSRKGFKLLEPDEPPAKKELYNGKSEYTNGYHHVGVNGITNGIRNGKANGISNGNATALENGNGHSTSFVNGSGKAADGNSNGIDVRKRN